MTEKLYPCTSSVIASRDKSWPRLRPSDQRILVEWSFDLISKSDKFCGWNVSPKVTPVNRVGIWKSLKSLNIKKTLSTQPRRLSAWHSPEEQLSLSFIVNFFLSVTFTGPLVLIRNSVRVIRKNGIVFERGAFNCRLLQCWKSCLINGYLKLSTLFFIILSALGFKIIELATQGFIPLPEKEVSRYLEDIVIT